MISMSAATERLPDRRDATLECDGEKNVDFRSIYFKNLSRTTSNRSGGADRVVTGHPRSLFRIR